MLRSLTMECLVPSAGPIEALCSSWCASLLSPYPSAAGHESNYFFWNGVSSVRSMKSIAERALRSVFKKSGPRASLQAYPGDRASRSGRIL
jgi:hypothetical protein